MKELRDGRLVDAYPVEQICDHCKKSARCTGANYFQIASDNPYVGASAIVLCSGFRSSDGMYRVKTEVWPKYVPESA